MSRDERYAAREARNNLRPPSLSLGRGDLIRSRSPSPSTPRTFNFPPPPPKKSAEEQQDEQFQDAMAYANPGMSDQATIQALTEALRGMKASSRKPELPAFDPKNIEIWIKRVDNAYRRAGITDPKDKFAHIEAKFEVDADPRVQAYIFGEGTEDEWKAMMGYLRNRYGRTKSQKASIILDGVKREGRLPSEMFAFIKDKVGDLTLDDVIKEMVLRELPIDIQRTIHEQTKSLDGSATTSLADSFFDKDGKPIHKSATATVSNIEQGPDADTGDEDEDINAIHSGRRRSRQNRPYNQRGRSQSTRTPWPNRQDNNNRPSHSNQQTSRTTHTPAFGEKKESRNPPILKNVKICRNHEKFGDNAYTCEPGCTMYPKWAGNGKAGRRT